MTRWRTRLAALLALEAGSHLRSPPVPGRTRRTGMSPGRALVPYGCAGTPAIDNACTAGRTMTTWPASVCGISKANAVEDDEKGRDKKRSHWLAPPIAPDRECPIPSTVPKFRRPRKTRWFSSARAAKAHPAWTAKAVELGREGI
jgi:hypothetical protein